jgi:hypothetical protein
VDLADVLVKAVLPDQWGIGVTVRTLLQPLANLPTRPVGLVRFLRNTQKFLNCDRVTLQKDDADRLSNQCDSDQGLPVATFSGGLLGEYLSRDILALDGTMLELRGAESAQTNDAAWFIRPCRLGVRNEVNRCEVSFAVSPRKAVGFPANLAAPGIFLVKEVPNSLVLWVPDVHHATSDPLGRRRLAFPAASSSSLSSVSDAILDCGANRMLGDRL